jgi:hypothetical protein
LRWAKGILVPLTIDPAANRATLINTTTKNPQKILCDGALAQTLRQELLSERKPVQSVEKIGPNDPRGYPFGDYVLKCELVDATFFKMRGDRVRLTWGGENCSTMRHPSRPEAHARRNSKLGWSQKERKMPRKSPT